MHLQHWSNQGPETDIQRSTPVNPPFPPVDNLRIVTTQDIPSLLFIWRYKIKICPSTSLCNYHSPPSNLPLYKGCIAETERRVVWLALVSGKAGSEKQGSQCTSTFFYCWQDIILVTFFFPSYKNPTVGVPTQTKKNKNYRKFPWYYAAIPTLLQSMFLSESLTLAMVTLGIVAIQLFNAITVLKGKMLTLVFIQDNKLAFPSALHKILNGWSKIVRILKNRAVRSKTGSILLPPHHPPNYNR